MSDVDQTPKKPKRKRSRKERNATPPKVAKCIVAGCTCPGRDDKRFYCLAHWAASSDGPRCSMPDCNEICADPYTDKLCKRHHPAFTELPPLASQVLAAMRDGTGDPVTAVQLVTGIQSRPQAAAKLEKMSEHVGFSRAMTSMMDTAGITDEFMLGHLKENIDAKKIVVTRDGMAVDAGKDIRASNSALDIALKLKGSYPAKEQKEKNSTINVQVNAVLPPIKQLEPTQSVFRIKADT